jgi:hypothetical protein
MGASGVGRIIAGDGFSFEGLLPATFLLLCKKFRLEQVMMKMRETQRLIYLLPIWQLDGSSGFRHGLQMAA